MVWADNAGDNGWLEVSGLWIFGRPYDVGIFGLLSMRNVQVF